MTQLKRAGHCPALFLSLGIAFLLIISITSILHKGITYDEPAHYLYGVKILHGDPSRPDEAWSSVMPFTALNALAYNSGYDMSPQILMGRFVTILFLLILPLVVFSWARELYGAIPAIFSFFLCCLDPNIIAHGRLVTLDLYAALAITASSYFFWRFTKIRDFPSGLLSAVILGLSQLAKYSVIVLFPIFFVIAIFKKIKFNYFLLFILVSVIIISAGFCFVPYAYIQGLKLCHTINANPSSLHNAYLLGRLHVAGEGPLGFPGYFFIVAFFKVPIATLTIIFLAFFSYCQNFRKHRFFENEIFLLAPVIFFLVYYNFFININVGIRHILPIFPLLYVFCGTLFLEWEKFSKFAKSGFILLIFYLATSVLSYFPHFISYCNEFIPDRKMAYKIFADSNLDWGGDRWYLEKYIEKHPGCMFRPDKPTTGRIIVGVNDFVGIFDANKYRWLRENYKPVDQIAYSYLVFDVPKDQKEQYRQSLRSHTSV